MKTAVLACVVVAARGLVLPRGVTTPRAVLPRGAAVARRAAADEGVVSALGRLREDLEALDADAAARPRVSGGEAAALAASVSAAAAAPFLENPALAELGVPAAALVVAAVGVAAEYGGRVATATAKEVAAVALRTASEAEAALAAAERAKSACPLCAGLAAAAAAVALALPRAAPPLLLGASPVAGALSSSERRGPTSEQAGPHTGAPHVGVRAIFVGTDLGNFGPQAPRGRKRQRAGRSAAAVRPGGLPRCSHRLGHPP